jgi:hypothetical protein
MPHPHLFAVRDNLDLREKEAHRLVAVAAVDDISTRSRPRWQWTHPQLAELMGISRPFTSLVGNYLDYRRKRNVLSLERGIRPYGPSGAQLFLYGEKDHPMDLLNLGTSGDRTEQMAKLLMEATARKILVEPEAVQAVEGMLSRSCGMAWETVVNTVQRQKNARTATTSTATAMGVKAA